MEDSILAGRLRALEGTALSVLAKEVAGAEALRRLRAVEGAAPSALAQEGAAPKGCALGNANGPRVRATRSASADGAAPSSARRSPPRVEFRDGWSRCLLIGSGLFLRELPLDGPQLPPPDPHRPDVRRPGRG